MFTFIYPQTILVKLLFYALEISTTVEGNKVEGLKETESVGRLSTSDTDRDNSENCFLYIMGEINDNTNLRTLDIVKLH